MKNHLRVLRATHGWSQEQLAEQLEVSRQTISSIETG
ncbi:MAG: helix-turn-helix domain-containing protein, partial [Anaerolineae bacterium]|nr:helix-turn-helix domain-containing protein [Anaerolineae bacterium]MCB0239829.1 helix-turn-helix domain-containing protein [Anaerolineae bacterium]